MCLSKDWLYIQGWIIVKFKITECSGTEWDKITRESLEDRQESLKVK